MARYSDFAELFLAALYVETEASGADYHRAGDIVAKYGIEYKPLWISQIAEEWETVYFRDVTKVLGAGYEGWSFRLGGAALRHLEERHGDLDKAEDLPKPVSEALEQAFPVPAVRIKSADWTGISARIDAAKLQAIREKASSLEAAINQADMDSRTRENAICRTRAVIALLEAPDTPWRLIVEILNNPVFTAVLNVAAILQLIFG